MKKNNLLVNFVGIFVSLTFCLLLWDMGREVIQNMTETHRGIALLVILALFSTVVLRYTDGMGLGSKNQSQSSGGYKMIEGTASQPYGLLPGPTEREVIPQYNDTYFGETVDL